MFLNHIHCLNPSVTSGLLPNPLFFPALLLVGHKKTNTLVQPDRLVITEHKHTRSSNKGTTYIKSTTDNTLQGPTEELQNFNCLQAVPEPY